jgi:uncharacterized protein
MLIDRDHLQKGARIELPNGQRFPCLVMATPEEIARGMQHRLDLQGVMLFVHPRPSFGYRYHMRNVPIALDIVFLTPDGVIDTIHENAHPGESGFGSRGLAQYVIEAGAGWATQYNLKPGDTIRILC